METSEAEGSGVEEELQLTPQEDRLLRRFFRRQALPYIAGTGAVAVLCLAFAFLRGDGRAPPAVPPATGGSTAALGELRADLDRAIADLAAVRTRAQQQAGEAARSASALEQRLAAVFQRIEKVEGRADAMQERVADALAQGPPAASPPASDGAAASAAAAASDPLLQVLQRLSDLEGRQEREESNAAAARKDVRDRLYSLELHRDQQESRREAAEQSNLERLDGVETRLFEIEKVLAARPGDAPQPPADADPR
jgi:hypothetical protein